MHLLLMRRHLFLAVSARTPWRAAGRVAELGGGGGAGQPSAGNGGSALDGARRVAGVCAASDGPGGRCGGRPGSKRRDGWGGSGRRGVTMRRRARGQREARDSGIGGAKAQTMDMARAARSRVHEAGRRRVGCAPSALACRGVPTGGGPSIACRGGDRPVRARPAAAAGSEGALAVGNRRRQTGRVSQGSGRGPVAAAATWCGLGARGRF